MSTVVLTTYQKSTFAKTNAEMKTWARPGMETWGENVDGNYSDSDGDENDDDYNEVHTRKTMAIFSSCHRPTSPKL